MRTGYYVLVEYPKIIRCDIAMWTRNISVESLQNRVNNVVACVSYKSEVDVPKLDFNTFLGCYASVLREAFGEDKQKIKEKILEAGEMFCLFRRESMRDRREERELQLFTDLVVDKRI